MDDYYSYRPLLRLPRPIALCGLPGVDVAQTARVLTMLTGLPLLSVDRRVEHLAGKAVELVQYREGVEARLGHERRVLAEALQAAPPPVIALSDVTLTDGELRRRVHAACDVWHLELDVEAALARVLAQHDEDRRRHFALTADGTIEAGELRAKLRFFLRLGREAARQIPVGARSPLEVGEVLAGELLAAQTP